MKVKLLFLSLLLAFGGIFLFYQKPKAPSSFYPVTEKKAFVIIIPSYNNEKYVKRNLFSVFSQKYDNYRVIYIDDHSRDKTLQKATELLKLYDKNAQTTLIHNPENLGSLANVYNAIHSCLNHEIVVILDGDDSLAHENVLSHLNEVYANPDVWLTYGNYLDYPSYCQEPKICTPLAKKTLKKKSFRKSPWITSHLRTFYASLFKQINLEDLFYRGHFYSMSGDLALMYPMLEMAKDHIQYIDSILYLYNRQNPLSDHKVNLSFQQECATHIRSKSIYPTLSHLPQGERMHAKKADLVIFSKEQPMQLHALIESIDRYVEGLNRTIVLYETKTEKSQKAYNAVKEIWPSVQFIEKKGDFKRLLNRLVFHTTPPESDYILFGTDGLIINDIIDLSKGIHLLDKTDAYGIYFAHHSGLSYCAHLSRHQPLPHLSPLKGIEINETPYAWQFSAGMDDWNSPNNFLFTLYSKKNLKKIFSQLSYSSADELLYEWGLHCDEQAVGICFHKPKSIALQKEKDSSATDLCELFLEGLKIDITPFFQKKGKSQEISSSLSFTPRTP